MINQSIMSSSNQTRKSEPFIDFQCKEDVRLRVCMCVCVVGVGFRVSASDSLKTLGHRDETEDLLISVDAWLLQR